MKSVMTHSFKQLPQANIPRSSFNRSHGVKATYPGVGVLYPMFVDEVLPGDTFNLRTNMFLRLSTPMYPIMDNMRVSTFYFFVPNRLIWDNFVKMMGEQKNPGDSTDYTTPVIQPGEFWDTGSTLYDYMGVPATATNDLDVNALPFRAYNLIYNEWFRDQNLQNAVTVDVDDGPDDETDYVLLRRGKRADYFTSCLPWPQKGEAVSIPLGTSAPIDYVTGLNQPGILRYSVSDNAYAVDDSLHSSLAGGSLRNSTGTTNLYYDPNGTLEADLSTATAATINSLRQAFQVQKLYERDARGGTRYTEMVRSHFGVVSPDARLQRPEFLGGGVAPINITPVLATNTDLVNLGDTGAFGTASFQGHGFVKSFTEHGILIGLMCIDADLTYQYGLDRMFSRTDRLSYYWPELAQIGEQAVLNKEIYVQGSAGGTDDDDVFGYQERFAEYRYKKSTIHGQMRSNHATTLDAWHLSEDFLSLPTLGATFIQSSPPLDRCLHDSEDAWIIADYYHELICARPMPMYGVPGNIDHF